MSIIGKILASHGRASHAGVIVEAYRFVELGFWGAPNSRSQVHAGWPFALRNSRVCAPRYIPIERDSEVARLQEYEVHRLQHSRSSTMHRRARTTSLLYEEENTILERFEVCEKTALPQTFEYHDKWSKIAMRS